MRHPMTNAILQAAPVQTHTVGSAFPVHTSLNHANAVSSSQFHHSSPFLANGVRKNGLGVGSIVAATTSSTQLGPIIPRSSAVCAVMSSGSTVSTCASGSSIVTESQNSAKSTNSDLSGPTVSSSAEGRFSLTDGMMVTSVTDIKTLDTGENLGSYSAGVEVSATDSSKKSLQSMHTTSNSVMSSSCATETKGFEMRRVIVAPSKSKLTPVQHSLISLARSSNVEEPEVRKRLKPTNTCTVPPDKTVKRKVLLGSDGQSFSLCTQTSGTASPLQQFNDSVTKRVTAGVSVDEEKCSGIDSKVGCSSTVSLPLPHQSSVASSCNVDQQHQLKNGKQNPANCRDWISWACAYVKSALTCSPPDLSVVFPPTDSSVQSEQQLSRSQRKKMRKAVKQVLAEVGADDLLPSFLQLLSSQSCTVTGNSETGNSTCRKRRRMTEKDSKQSDGISSHVKPSLQPGVDSQFQFPPKAKEPAVEVASGKKTATKRIIRKKSKQSSGISNDVKPTVEPCDQYQRQVHVPSTELSSTQEMGTTAFSLATVSSFVTSPSDGDKQIVSYTSTRSESAAYCGNSGNSNDLKPSEQPSGKVQFPPQVQISSTELASSKEMVCGNIALSPATVVSQIQLSSTASAVTTTDDDNDIQPCFKYQCPPQVQVPGNSQNVMVTGISVSQVEESPVPRESLPAAAVTAVGFTPIVCSEQDVRSSSGIQVEGHQTDHVLDSVDCKVSRALVASCSMSDVNNNDICDVDDATAASVVDLTADETDYIVIDSDGYGDESTPEVSPLVPELLLSFTENLASASPAVLTRDSEDGKTAERLGTDSDDGVVTRSVSVTAVSAAATSVNDLTDLVLPDSSTSPDSDKTCYVPISAVKRNVVSLRKPSVTSSSVLPLVVEIPASGERTVTVSRQITTLPARHVNGRLATTVTAGMNVSHCQTTTLTTCAGKQTVLAVPRIAGAGRRELKRKHSEMELSTSETIVIDDDEDEEDFVIVDEVSGGEANITDVASSQSNQCKISYCSLSVAVLVHVPKT